jgi:flagellar biosynthesis protein FliP
MRLEHLRRAAWRAAAASWRPALAFSVLSALSAAASAQAGGTGSNLPLVIGQGPGGNSYSVPIQTLLFFTALSFLPALLLMMTGFTRIVIVLSLRRCASSCSSRPARPTCSCSPAGQAARRREGREVPLRCWCRPS